MATKKKTRKQTKSKKSAGKKKMPKKKAPVKKSAVKAKPALKKSAIRKTAASRRPRNRGRGQDLEIAEITPAGMGARSGGQSGSLQGLSDIESADSESVDELIEEGNAFEAEVVEGVENAPDADEGEIHTHEVPENDVPEEYDGNN